MTTIAFKDGRMAADRGMISRQTLLVGSPCKLRCHRVNDETKIIAGLCGVYPDAEDFWGWFVAGADRENVPKFERHDNDDAPEFEVLVVHPGPEIVVWRQWFQPQLINEPFWAIGSGQQLAIGAMEAGASAVQAVEIACKRDVGTFGEVDFESLLL